MAASTAQSSPSPSSLDAEGTHELPAAPGRALDAIALELEADELSPDDLVEDELDDEDILELEPDDEAETSGLDVSPAPSDAAPAPAPVAIEPVAATNDGDAQVDTVVFTSPFSRTPPSSAMGAAHLASSPVVARPAMGAPRPSSIAPIALDVPAPSHHPLAGSTLRMSPMSPGRAASVVRPGRGPLVAVASGAFVAALAAAAVIALMSRGEGEAARTALLAPRSADVAGARAGALEPPQTASTNAPALAPAEPESITTASLADAPSPTRVATTAAAAPAGLLTAATAAPSPTGRAPAPVVSPKTRPVARAAPPAPAPPAPVVAPLARAAAPLASTGAVVVDRELKTVVVDGVYRRVTDGRVVLSCGPHRVRAGLGPVRAVDVPCGGAVSLE